MLSPYIPGVWVAIVSHRRPHFVCPMSVHIGAATWYVPSGQGAAYRDAGAPSVVEVNGMLIAQRNAALREAWGRGAACMMLDDDLRGVKQARKKGSNETTPLGAVAAANLMVERLAADGRAKLAGVAPTPNPFFYPGRPVSPNKFCIASWLLLAPSDLFFREAYTTKEDYDLTARHLRAHGAVCRNDDILATFNHYTAAGGLTGASARRAESEEAMCAQLLREYPECIYPHPRRAGEVVLRWRGIRRPT